MAKNVCALIGAECPRTGDPNAKRFCPAWSDGVVWTNQRSGEETVVNCSFRAMMPGMVQVIAASNRPAAAVESMRNELVRGFESLNDTIGTGMALALQDGTDPAPKQLVAPDAG